VRRLESAWSEREEREERRASEREQVAVISPEIVLQSFAAKMNPHPRVYIRDNGIGDTIRARRFSL